jgi:hypothetical protein
MVKTPAKIQRNSMQKKRKKDQDVSYTKRKNAQVIHQGKRLSANELYNKQRLNISMDGVTYVCGNDVKETKNNKDKMAIQKTLVREKSGDSDNIWILKPRCRTSVHPQYEKCKGRIYNYFQENDYWSAPHAAHKCQVKGGASVRDIAQSPPLTMIAAAQSWGITKTMIYKMITDLKSVPKIWWESLPRQG